MQQQQQGTQSNQQQGFMQEPPQVISVKDHLYINDMLSWNLLAMKKRISTHLIVRTQKLKKRSRKLGKCISAITSVC